MMHGFDRFVPFVQIYSFPTTISTAPFPHLFQLQAQEQIQLFWLVLTPCMKKANGHDHSEGLPLKGSD